MQQHERGRDVGGRYRLWDEMDHAPRGRSWAALDVHLDMCVVVHLLNAHLAAVSGSDRDAWPQCEHPHVVRVLGGGEDEAGRGYWVTEHHEAITLRKLLQSGPLSFLQTMHIGVQVAEALAYLHEQGVVHGDVRPANVLVGKNEWRGHVWLQHVGLAWRMDREGGELANELDADR
jgi:serine/threonine protein kinase